MALTESFVLHNPHHYVPKKSPLGTQDQLLDQPTNHQTIVKVKKDPDVEVKGNFLNRTFYTVMKETYATKQYLNVLLNIITLN